MPEINITTRHQQGNTMYISFLSKLKVCFLKVLNSERHTLPLKIFT